MGERFEAGARTLMPVAALVLLSAGLGWMLLNSAGVETRDANIGLVLIGLAACLAGWGERRRGWLEPAVGMPVALLALVVWQVVPLPLAVVRLLSPARANTLHLRTSVRYSVLDRRSVEWLEPSLDCPPAPGLQITSVLG